MSRLAGKVAIVTGGGGGIGKSVSQSFAAYGAKVLVAEIDAKRANETVAEPWQRFDEARSCWVVAEGFAQPGDGVIQTMIKIDKNT